MKFVAVLLLAGLALAAAQGGQVNPNEAPPGGVVGM